MKRRLIACLLVFSLLTPALPIQAALNPVQGLQFKGATYCTVFSINERQGLWATAAHCAVAAFEMEQEQRTGSTIDGKPATIIYVDTFTDVAVFHAAAYAPAFKLAKQVTEVGEKIVIIGYPYGITRTRTEGTMAARDIPINHPMYALPVISDILDITVAGGNSGSPVLNAKGEVVGILWGGFTQSAHAISVPLEAVRRAIGSSFGR